MQSINIISLYEKLTYVCTLIIIPPQKASDNRGTLLAPSAELDRSYIYSHNFGSHFFEISLKIFTSDIIKSTKLYLVATVI